MKFITSALILLSLFSCDDDDTMTTPKESQSSSKYIVALQSYTDASGTQTDYLLEYDDISSLESGTITSIGQGIPQNNGWSFFYEVDDSVFSISYEVSQGSAYRLGTDESLEEISSFVYNSTLNTFSDLNGENLLAFELSFGGYDDKGFVFFDASEGKISKTIYDSIDTLVGDGTETNPGATPWVTGAVLRDDLLFVAYHKFDGLGGFTTPDVDRAYIAVYSYPELEKLNIIEDDRTSPIGTNGHSSGVVKTESNDIYSFSSSSLSSGFTSATKPAGVLRILDGESEFDSEYFFDVENTTNGGKIFWMDYVGNNKALARIILDDAYGAYEWGTFLNYETVKLVVLDFEAQTITNVSGIPNHTARYTSKLFVEDGIAYIGAETGADTDSAETAIYAVNTETATATKGAVVDGKSIKGIFKISN